MHRRIFIAEDERDLLELYAETFQICGHEVVGLAHNGAEAVELFSRLERRPDVIIMDHRMPIKTGLEATLEILRIDPSAKIIFASADQSVEQDALKAGIARFISKPFDINILVEDIEREHDA